MLLAVLAVSIVAEYIACHGHHRLEFQALIDAGMSVTGGCSLDLTALRDSFSADAPAMEWDLKPRLKCGVCGGKRVTLTYTPDTQPERPQ
ncbi:MULTISPECIES: hypothetical protein [unclassified Mesorhizobium]|uniref:hypothetical protein n=1 Tax=unclassified Mesorhizobium TaxID=325217 RepID=UPI00241764BE|nr:MULTISPECIES: hypothetical protein [unclassified Mesorhizobium]MDG4902787.1 hypothetical protein [Mesorhizobium sp. WSM4962]MDG4920796.1 hypothetical protein [Mesorhizobium sp. WSM4989]